MKILVCGAGVLGCNLAADLSRAGKEVTLLARGQWAKTLRERGLRIKNMFSPRTSTRNDSGYQTLLRRKRSGISDVERTRKRSGRVSEG